MPSIVIPEPIIPLVNDPELVNGSYPLSKLGEDLIIEHVNTNCNRNCILIALFPCFIPCFLIGFSCYYKHKPRIQVSQHIIPGTLCPKCRIGKIKYCMLLDGECCAQPRSKELFICLDCNTVYPEYQLSKYFGPNPPFRQTNTD